MKKSITFFLALCFATTMVVAQSNPVGARSAALAGISSTLSDVFSAHNNQAGLGNVKSIQVGAYYENRFLLKQLGYSALVAAVPIKKGAFGLSYTGFGYSQYKQSKVGVGYGMALSENLSAGVQLNYLNYRIGDIYGTAPAITAELGLQGKLPKQVTVAAHIYNPNRAKLNDYNNEKVPAHLRVGIQYTFSERLVALVEADKSSLSPLNIKGGLEYAPAKEFYLRAGGASYPAQASFGVGLALQSFKLDLSSAYHSVLGFSPQVGMHYSFGKNETEKKPEEQ